MPSPFRAGSRYPSAALEPAMPSPFRAGSRYPSAALEPAMPSPFRAGSRYPHVRRKPRQGPVRTAGSSVPTTRKEKQPWAPAGAGQLRRGFCPARRGARGSTTYPRRDRPAPWKSPTRVQGTALRCLGRPGLARGAIGKRLYWGYEDGSGRATSAGRISLIRTVPGLVPGAGWSGTGPGGGEAGGRG